MYGVASIRRRTGDEGTPPWVPDGALAYLDFVGGQYYAAGATWAVSTLLGGAFDAGDIEAGGMAVWYTNANRPLAIGALAAVIEANLADGFTIVFEIDDPMTDADGPLLTMSDTADFTVATWYFQIYMGDGFYNVLYRDLDAINDSNAFPSFDGGGINRIGVTYSRALGGGQWRYAMSVNGDAAQSNDAAYDGDAFFPTAGPASIRIGHVDETVEAFDSVLIRSITIYAAVDEAALAVLTELPTA